MIRFENVSKIYPNGHVALKNINLNIEKGEFVFITGESGAGKSTLIKLLHREQHPTKGSIEVAGLSLSKINERSIPHYRRDVSIVFQDFRLINNKTVYENIDLVLKIQGVRKRVRETKIIKVLKMVGLESKKDYVPLQLSGGEKQRVALARAVVNEPVVLIADEPTGNLDSENANAMLQIFEKINDFGVTILIVTHDKELISVKERRVVSLNAGELNEKN